VATTFDSFPERGMTGGRLMARFLGIGFSWPRVIILISALWLGVATIFPFWSLTLHAPQYPDGLVVTLYTYKITGDVREIDGLNHYIGMMPLDQAAEFERTIAIPAVVVIILLGITGALLRRKWTALLALPIALFPIVFAVDLFYWLYHAGNNLDPTAPLSSSIKPFTPAILGEGVVGQFSTTANFTAGFWIAVAAALLATTGIVGMLRRSAQRAPS
jgi:copper chaperone NosL